MQCRGVLLLLYAVQKTSQLMASQLLATGLLCLGLSQVLSITATHCGSKVHPPWQQLNEQVNSERELRSGSPNPNQVHLEVHEDKLVVHAQNLSWLYLLCGFNLSQNNSLKFHVFPSCGFWIRSIARLSKWTSVNRYDEWFIFCFSVLKGCSWVWNSWKEVEVEAWDRMLQLLLAMYILFKLLSQTRSSQMATEMVRRDILKTKWKCVACCSWECHWANHAVSCLLIRFISTVSEPKILTS